MQYKYPRLGRSWKPHQYLIHWDKHDIWQLNDVATVRFEYFAYSNMLIMHMLISYGLIIWASAPDHRTIFELRKIAIVWWLFKSSRSFFIDAGILTLPLFYVYISNYCARKNIIGITYFKKRIYWIYLLYIFTLWLLLNNIENLC